MSANDVLQGLSWLLYAAIFVAVLLRTLRRPTPAHVDMTLFFLAIALVIALGLATTVFNLAGVAWIGSLSGAIFMALPYLLLRLVRDFAEVPAWIVRATEAGFVVAAVLLFALPQPLPSFALLYIVGYFVLIT